MKLNDPIVQALGLRKVYVKVVPAIRASRMQAAEALGIVG